MSKLTDDAKAALKPHLSDPFTLSTYAALQSVAVASLVHLDRQLGGVLGVVVDEELTADFLSFAREMSYAAAAVRREKLEALSDDSLLADYTDAVREETLDQAADAWTVGPHHVHDLSRMDYEAELMRRLEAARG